MRLASAFFSASFVLFAIGSAGCDVPVDPGGSSEDIGTDSNAIINGSLDTTDAAVVGIIGPGFSCSGTIIQVKNGQGYVLTAGHCCPKGKFPFEVVIGNDYNTGQAFSVVNGSVVADSCYGDCAGSTDDVCMLRFSGASGSTPVIPVMTPATDNLALGQNLTYVGYGITQSPPGGQNSIRRKVTKPIGYLDSYFVEYSDPATSGTCEGDSGGPGLATINGSFVVASVTSFGDEACTALGTSIRASSVYDKLVGPYLADSAQLGGSCPVETDCQECINESTDANCGANECAKTITDCFNDTNCAALANCYNGCNGVGSCIKTCNTQHENGLEQYTKIDACVCNGPCAAVCGDNNYCKLNQCGIKPPGATADCKKCTEGDCCAEAYQCSLTGVCKACFTDATPKAACATNADAQAYYQCIESKCAASGCVLNDPDGTTTTTTTSATTSVTTGSGGAGGAPLTTTDVTTTTSAATTGSTGGAGGSGDGKTEGSCSCSEAGEGDASGWRLSALALGALGLFGRRRSDRDGKKTA